MKKKRLNRPWMADPNLDPLRQSRRAQLEALVHVKAEYERPSLIRGFWCWKVLDSRAHDGYRRQAVALPVHQGLAYAAFWRRWGGPTREPTYTMDDLLRHWGG